GSGERVGYALEPVRRPLGDRSVPKLQPAGPGALYGELFRGGLALPTIKLIHRVLHRALGQAKVWGVIRDNPAELAKPPREPDRETEMLQPDRAAELLERLRGRPFYMLASLALATGLRRNEMLALRWQDIDLDAGRLPVEQAL